MIYDSCYHDESPLLHYSGPAVFFSFRQALMTEMRSFSEKPCVLQLGIDTRCDMGSMTLGEPILQTSGEKTTTWDGAESL